MPLPVDHAALFSGCTMVVWRDQMNGARTWIDSWGQVSGERERLVSAVCIDQGGSHLSNLRPNICVVTLERADSSSMSDIACSMRTCADERWATRSWLHYYLRTGKHSTTSSRPPSSYHA